jgi:hypothetical protein
MPLLGVGADARLLPCLAKAAAAFVEEELGDAVIVGDEEVGVAGAAQVSCDGGKGPAARLEAELRGNFLEAAAAEVVKEILAPSVGCVLEALGHDLRVLEMPEIDVLGIVAAEEKVELAVAVVIEPDGGVGVDPGRQAGLCGNACEMPAAVVVVELRPTPLI